MGGSRGAGPVGGADVFRAAEYFLSHALDKAIAPSQQRAGRMAHVRVLVRILVVQLLRWPMGIRSREPQTAADISFARVISLFHVQQYGDVLHAAGGRSRVDGSMRGSLADPRTDRSGAHLVRKGPCHTC